MSKVKKVGLKLDGNSSKTERFLDSMGFNHCTFYIYKKNIILKISRTQVNYNGRYTCEDGGLPKTECFPSFFN